MASMISLLAHYIRLHGPVGTARVSSAQARGAAKRYAYWGAVRYEIRLTRAGRPANFAIGRASSDRRSVAGAERDADAICGREGRIRCDVIGEIDEDNAAVVLRRLAAECDGGVGVIGVAEDGRILEQYQDAHGEARRCYVEE